MNCLLIDRAVLEVTGDDRVAFLQGLVSNDVTLAAPGQAVWAAMLTPQGKWLADFFIHSDGERLLLDVERDQAAMLTQKLTRYRLRAKVAVQPTSMAVHAGWDEAIAPGAVPDPRLPEAGWRGLDTGPANCDPQPQAYNQHRLQLGLPNGTHDMEAEKTTLLEAGFAELNGVSWTKGCYMGQELTARTKYRGLLKRRLVPVDVLGPQPARGTPVTQNGAEVGDMRSSLCDAKAGIGLALLRIDALNETEFRCGDAILIPRIPAWMQLNSD
jgi:folate-binding protein YgfZ